MVVVEVRQGPLQDEEEEEKEEEEKEAATNIKSNNPHLAGGELLTIDLSYINQRLPMD